MTIALDTSHALRTREELTALARAVRDAPAAEPETDSLEWKSEWDLGTAEHAFETARHILGFGNRRVGGAAAQFEGCAYLLAGVEPGRLLGTTVPDPATVEDRVGRYVESGAPRWSPHQVSLDGKDILIVVVEAPRVGDSICTLQKGFEGFREGRIFIRRHGKTPEADPAEVRALEQRLCAREPELDLTIERADTDELRGFSISRRDRDAWLQGEEERLALPAEQPSADTGLPGLFSMPSISPLLNEDPRTKAAYRKEVDRYLQVAEERYRGLVMRRSVERELAKLHLRLVNPTPRNYEGVAVVLEVSAPFVWLEPDEIDALLPTPPKPWGKKNRFEIATPAIKSIFDPLNSVSRKNGLATVSFGPQHVRPMEEIDLPPVYLSLATGGDDLMVRWSLTSTSVNGRQSGEIFYSVAEELISLSLRAT